MSRLLNSLSHFPGFVGVNASVLSCRYLDYDYDPRTQKCRCTQKSCQRRPKNKWSKVSYIHFVLCATYLSRLLVSTVVIPMTTTT